MKQLIFIALLATSSVALAGTCDDTAKEWIAINKSMNAVTHHCRLSIDVRGIKDGLASDECVMFRTAHKQVMVAPRATKKACGSSRKALEAIERNSGGWLPEEQLAEDTTAIFRAMLILKGSK